MEYLQYYSSIPTFTKNVFQVLNLVINGIPSILWLGRRTKYFSESFKPCYKWNTFNTQFYKKDLQKIIEVLNLVINGIPSILNSTEPNTSIIAVLNLVINGIPSIH